MLVWAMVAIVLSGEPPPAGEISCDLVKVRADERRLGPTPPEGEGGSGDSAAHEAGALHFLTLRCKGRQYVARVVGDLPGVEPTESKPSPLLVRFAGEKVFIKWPEGREVEAPYTPVETTPPPKPRAPTKK